MEELLVLIFQFVFEVLLQVLAELPWDLFVSSRKPSPPQDAGNAGLVVLSVLAGGVIGGLSLLCLPKTLLHSSTARMANLVVAPVMSAYVASLMSLRASDGVAKKSSAGPRASCAAGFTFALAVIRFTYATRP